MKVTKRKYLSPRIKVKEIRPHLLGEASAIGHDYQDDSSPGETWGDNTGGAKSTNNFLEYGYDED